MLCRPIASTGGPVAATLGGMTPEQRIWVVFGGLFVVSVALIGSIRLPSSALTPILMGLVLLGVGIALYVDRQGRRRH